MDSSDVSASNDASHIGREEVEPVILHVSNDLPGQTFYYYDSVTYNVSTQHVDKCVLSYSLFVFFRECDNETMCNEFRLCDVYWGQDNASLVYPGINWTDGTMIRENCYYGYQRFVLDNVNNWTGYQAVWHPDFEGTNWTNITMFRDGDNFYATINAAFPIHSDSWAAPYGMRAFFSVTITAYNGELNTTAYSYFTDYQPE
jgi:hypothetical protein